MKSYLGVDKDPFPGFALFLVDLFDDPPGRDHVFRAGYLGDFVLVTHPVYVFGMIQPLHQILLEARLLLDFIPKVIAEFEDEGGRGDEAAVTALPSLFFVAVEGIRIADHRGKPSDGHFADRLGGQKSLFFAN